MLNFRTGMVAILFSTAAQVANRMISIVSLVVLARVLTPEDFGLVAVAMIFLNFAQALGATGGYSYLLSRQEMNDEMVYTNWTLNFILYSFLGIVLAASSGFIADFYDDQRLKWIILAFGLLIVLRKINSPMIVYKHKNQQLGTISALKIINKFVSVALTISVAVIYESYWALVVGHFVSTGFYAIATYFIAPSIPRLTLKNVKPQWNFSKWLLPQSIINFVKAQFDTIWVSAHFDKAIIGAYNSMRYYASLPNVMFINTVFGTLLPQIAELKSSKEYYRKQIQVLLYIMTLICAPTIYLMVEHANFVVGFVLGAQWQPYSELLAIFAFMIISMTINNLSLQMAKVNDKTKLLFYYSLVSILAQIGLFTLVDFDGIYQLAMYKLAVDLVLSWGFYLYLVVLVFGIRAIFFLLMPMIPVGAIAYICGLMTNLVVTDSSNLLGFVLHCSLMCSLFLVINCLIILLLKNRIHCFMYAHGVLLKAVNRISSMKKRFV